MPVYASVHITTDGPGGAGSVGSVDSFEGRTGAVVATSGDYTAAEITNTPAGNIAAVTVQAAINELDSEKLGTGTNATAIAFTPQGNIAATDVDGAIAELDTEKLGTSPNATAIVFTPQGNIAATDVDAAIVELDDEKWPKHVTIDAETGTTYQFDLTDEAKVVTLNNASSIALTVPPNSTVAFPVGTQLNVVQLGAGAVTWTAGGGVTLNTNHTLVTNGQYSLSSALKTATDTWIVFGDLVP